MSVRSKAAFLPEDIRRELDRRLVSGAFSGYAALAEWLTEQGYPISHAAVHRYGSQLERKIETMRLSTEYAKAIVTGAPDAEGAVSEATLRMAQERLFTLLSEAGEDASLKDVASACRAVADMARAGTSVSAERRKTLAEASDAAEGAARKTGVSPETAAAIRAAIEGLD